MDEAAIPPLVPTKFDPLIGPVRAREFAAMLATTRDRLAGRTLWCVNSTAKGGGVAEMLSSILCYLVGADIRTRWLVIDGDEEFFEVTKGLHHLLHGDAGDAADGLRPGSRHRAVYERTLAADQNTLLESVAPGDPVILHDPQTVGLAPALAEHGAPVIWSCHVGADAPNSSTRAAWDFLRGYVEATRAQVFSRSQYAWEGLDPDRVAVIPPCVDAFSPKNQPLERSGVDAILSAAGVMAMDRDTVAPATFVRQDGSSGTVTHASQMHEGTALTAEMPIVTQISRWDPLKDHLGVMRAFVDHVPPATAAHLVLAGPSPDSVADDPEGLGTFQELLAAWEALPSPARSRVHLACLPMQDPEENAAIVNALQRRSDVIVQKSLAEGFGLTVAEAMLKGRPTVGSRVGGIQDQITHGISGLLVDDPDDLPGFGQAMTRLLDDQDFAARLGQAGVERVVDEYLAPCHLTRYLGLVDRVLA